MFRSTKKPNSKLPLRVCFMINAMNCDSTPAATGGTEGQLRSLIQHLDRSKIIPSLCLLDGTSQLTRSQEPRDCDILRLEIRSLRRPAVLTGAWRLWRFLRQRRIDVLQVHFRDSTFLGVPVATLARVPRIVRTRRNLGHDLTRFDRYLGRVVGRLADATLANCEACRQSAIDQEHAAPHATFVLENGIDLRRFARVTPIEPTHNGRLRRVGMVANLRHIKSPEVFIKAAALAARSHPNSVFEIAGAGDQEHMQRQIEKVGIADRVQLLGHVSDIPAFLGQLDVAVLTSLSEGLSNALMEYMAAGRPIVATAVGGNVELIENGVHGLIVPPGDAAATANAINRLLSDPVLAARLGVAARQRILKHNNLDVTARLHEEFYLQLAGAM